MSAGLHCREGVRGRRDGMVADGQLGVGGARRVVMAWVARLAQGACGQRCSDAAAGAGEALPAPGWPVVEERPRRREPETALKSGRGLARPALSPSAR